jgi:hypothetical protein
MAPVNVAGQPITAVRELRRQGVDVTLLQYTAGAAPVYAYEHDVLFDLGGRHRLQAMTEALVQTFADGYDIYHFWMSTLFNGPPYVPLYGLDLPYLKARGKRIIYRATGSDVRTRSGQMERNPYHPFRYGFETDVDDGMRERFLAYLADYADALVVQDPELAEFLPGARIIPRAIDLDAWPDIGIGDTDRPLVVHAPSNPAVKGTALIEAALAELADEGLEFDYKRVEGMSHEEAMGWYRRADVVVDQLLLGWYGVLTLEALALGKPVAVYVRDDLYASFEPRIPVTNVTPDTVKDGLRALIGDDGVRRELAAQGREFVAQVHDVRGVAAQLRELYAEVMERPPSVPASNADVEYFAEQYVRLEDQQGARRRDARVRALEAAVAELPALRSAAARYDALAVEASELRRRQRRSQAVAAELPELRRKARRFDAVADSLPELRRKARRFEAIEPALEELRSKARRFDAVAGRLQELRSKARRLDAVADRLPELRRKAQRWDEAAEELPELRSKARRLDEISEELPELRSKARRLDEISEELPELRSKARRLDEISKELPELRSKARRLDEISKELPELRLKARGLDAVTEQLPALRGKARQYDILVEQLPELRSKARRLDAVAEQLPLLRGKARGYDALAEQVRELRATVRRLGGEPEGDGGAEPGPGDAAVRS